MCLSRMKPLAWESCRNFDDVAAESGPKEEAAITFLSHIHEVPFVQSWPEED